jgi:hypothetical protein
MQLRNICIIFFGGMFFACGPMVTEVELPDESGKICVMAYPEADSMWRIGITKGQHILSSAQEFDDIRQAEVTILENGEILAELNYQQPASGTHNGMFVNDQIIEAGKTYQLQVKAPGFVEVNASCKLPEPVAILKAEILSDEMEDYKLPIQIEFNDPPGEVNFYELVMLTTIIRYNPQTGDPYFLSHYNSFVLTQDPLYCQKTQPFDFLEPVPIPLPVFFSDDGLDGQSIKIVGKIEAYSSPTNNMEEIERAIILRSVTREYFLNKQTKELQEATANDPFAQPVQVFSNISNGYGIFAGYSQSKIVLE